MSQAHYLPILVRDGGVTDWEREFCISLLGQQRRGRVLSEKQLATLDKIVDAFKARSLTQDDTGEVLE